MAKGMAHRHLMSTVSEEWLIRTIDKRYEVIEEYKRVTTTVTATSVIFKDGVAIKRKRKKEGKTTSA